MKISEQSNYHAYDCTTDAALQCCSMSTWPRHSTRWHGLFFWRSLSMLDFHRDGVTGYLLCLAQLVLRF